MYENDLKIYNNQQLIIQKLIEFINQTVSSLYLESCCKPEDKINIWYINLQKTASISTIQEYNHAWNQYTKVIQLLTKLKDYEK